jgi:hypothetical protein
MHCRNSELSATVLNIFPSSRHPTLCLSSRRAARRSQLAADDSLTMWILPLNRHRVATSELLRRVRFPCLGRFLDDCLGGASERAIDQRASVSIQTYWYRI